MSPFTHDFESHEAIDPVVTESLRQYMPELRVAKITTRRIFISEASKTLDESPNTRGELI